MRDLVIKDVSFSYPGNFLAVDGINMEIKAGENVAIVGQNGAGKYEYKRLYDCSSF